MEALYTLTPDGDGFAFKLKDLYNIVKINKHWHGWEQIKILFDMVEGIICKDDFILMQVDTLKEKTYAIIKPQHMYEMHRLTSSQTSKVKNSVFPARLQTMVKTRTVEQALLLKTIGL